MDEKKHREIARMDWKELARNLQIPEGKKTRGASKDEALREYFGD